MPAAAGSAPTVDALTETAPGIARFPSRSELAKLPPAMRRQLLRAAFDTPLRGKRLRQLRRAIRARGDCLGVLSRGGRRALELRAGLGDEPVSRRVVARRLGMSPLAVLRLERSSLRRLFDADERGLCGAGAAAIGGLLAGGPGDFGGAPGDDDGGGSGSNDPRSANAVLADVAEGGPGIDLGDGSQGSSEALLFFLLTLLVLIGPLVAAAALRRRASGAAATTDDGRPLLFLDVDGVIALDPLCSPLPPGHISAGPHGLAYLPDRTPELVRELATRFDIVWATGWEHYVNTSLLGPLGLGDALPVLSFGRKARAGSSTWKIKPVDDYAGNRPAAWIDDHFVASHERWAADRPQPTLLVPTDPHAGLTPDHVDRLLRWADDVDRNGEGGIRTLEGRYRP